jgi:chitinase
MGNSNTPKKRLSISRLFLVLILFAGIGFYAYSRVMEWRTVDITASLKPFYAPYVDVTATPYYEFEQLGLTTHKNAVLSFIVSSTKDACTPTWGNAYTVEQAKEELDLDRRIARLRQLGGDIAISFGGLNNHELALNCLDQNELISAYEKVINQYQVELIDLDLEGDSLKNVEAMERRAKALSILQKKIRQNGKHLDIWLTLPVLPQGLTEDGTNAISTMLKEGVDISGVNIMTMNYGQSKDASESMGSASKKALTETHRQLGILYLQSGVSLSSNTLWRKLGATPMIGQNDIQSEVFDLEDAKSLNEYALQNNLIRISIWSANRDLQCGDNYANTANVSDSCSGVKQDKLEFSTILSQGYTGVISQNTGIITEKEETADPTKIVDDPKTSPYIIWSEQGVYLEGTKVVWRKNVYQAKWWTQGDLPDNPVLQSWQTPWQLIGPVLPGEKPVQQATLPKGIYKDWDGDKQYDAGDKVVFNGVPYKAKWWTQGDSPAASTSNPTSSPWVALTQREIEVILKQLKK